LPFRVREADDSVLNHPIEGSFNNPCIERVHHQAGGFVESRGEGERGASRQRVGRRESAGAGGRLKHRRSVGAVGSPDSAHLYTVTVIDGPPLAPIEENGLMGWKWMVGGTYTVTVDP
jgi:hypothetical protein